jgi:hypothetical protein
MTIKDLGSIIRVCVSEWEVYHFKSRWPGSGIPDTRMTFDFDKRNGDLVDIYPMDVDGSDVVALAEDAQNYARKRGAL